MVVLAVETFLPTASCLSAPEIIPEQSVTNMAFSFIVHSSLMVFRYIYFMKLLQH